MYPFGSFNSINMTHYPNSQPWYNYNNKPSNLVDQQYIQTYPNLCKTSWHHHISPFFMGKKRGDLPPRLSGIGRALALSQALGPGQARFLVDVADPQPEKLCRTNCCNSCNQYRKQIATWTIGIQKWWFWNALDTMNDVHWFFFENFGFFPNLGGRSESRAFKTRSPEHPKNHPRITWGCCSQLFQVQAVSCFQHVPKRCEGTKKNENQKRSGCRQEMHIFEPFVLMLT